MRLTQRLWTAPSQKNARRYQKEPVPFQMLLPLELKKTVSGKSDKLKEAACMQELAVMFACFKKNEFDQQQCLKEITAFQGCYKDYSKRMIEAREKGTKGILVPGETKLSHKQLNKLFRQFPPQKYFQGYLPNNGGIWPVGQQQNQHTLPNPSYPITYQGQ